MNESFTVTRRTFVSGLLSKCFIGLLVAWLPGCSRPAPIEIAIGFDVTPKGVARRIKIASPLANFVKKGDVFKLYVTDHKTSLISTIRPASTKDASNLLTATSEKMLAKTDLALYFETMAAEAERDSLPLVIVLYTDGLDDNSKPDVAAARIEAAARRLSSCPRLRALIVAGTVRDIRSGWTELPDMLSPLGSKLSVLPMATLKPDEVTRLVKEARGQAASAAQEGSK